MTESYKLKSKIATAVAFIAAFIVYIGEPGLRQIIPVEYSYFIPILVLLAGYFVTQSTENKRVEVAEKLVHENKSFLNNEMSKVRNLPEINIIDIKREDFDMNKLDKNGDQEVKKEFKGNNQNAWKNGWFIEGGRLLEA